MAGVEAEEFVVGDGVTEVELVRAGGVGFGADAEELAFDGVEIVFGIDGFGEDLIQ